MASVFVKITSRHYLPSAYVLALFIGMPASPVSAQSEPPANQQETQAPRAKESPDETAAPQLRHVSPGYYRQVDQSLGAQLPIYDDASTDAAVIVQLPGDTILNSDGEEKEAGDILWQKVSLGEIEGWVHADKLTPAKPIPFAGTDLPVLGVCGGTEPSWSIEWNSNTVTYSNIAGLLHRAPLKAVESKKDESATLLTAEDETFNLKMTITAKQCTYTPLDSFVWGEAVATITQTGQKPVELKGCCRPVSDGYH
ncbi:hypothetical protein PsAD2_03422 [Pseudovibrio axinellae]|uniref:Bacterial SH3 domain protein n=1 Tax=Pseudovibrio axinellae TaxID=989403 RepID=A0A165WI38_9HYPH|nr:SH3 domain-containing protein [Pseudovibrio axinellae]KZL16548.1 hypothetical protein PsAD2_03422 [Pseudovibrio axinellae]SEQ16285.1 hypothetical protein SAMN05421798_10224 [Pseudovibrio axinellae]